MQGNVTVQSAPFYLADPVPEFFKTHLLCISSAFTVGVIAIENTGSFFLGHPVHVGYIFCWSCFWTNSFDLAALLTTCDLVGAWANPIQTLSQGLF